jgi:hypothetical protein
MESIVINFPPYLTNSHKNADEIREDREIYMLYWS